MKNVSDIYPLSPMQELMLVHTLSHPDSDRLFNQVVFTLEGDLDIAVFEGCFGNLIQRHPILRTMFLWEGLKAPVQVVRETVTLDWQNHDWRSLSADEQNTRFLALLQEDRQRGFELNRAPLMRVHLCQRSDELYRMLWSTHHLIGDRWSVDLIMREIAMLYNAQRTGTSAQIEERRPFRDLIRWLGEQDSHAAETFWRGELRGITRPTRLSKAPSSTTPVQVGEAQCRLDLTDTHQLRHLAADHHLTLGTIVLGAWALLHGLVNPTGADLLLGVSISGRPPTLPGVEGIIGPFLNNVPLRVSFPAEKSAIEWLHDLQERQQAIQTYGYISPLKIQEWSDIPTGSPHYETLFMYQTPVKMPETGFQMRPESATLQTNVPLALAAEGSPDGLLLWFAYHQPQYTPERVAQLQAALVQALKLIAIHPDTPILDLLEQLRVAAPHIEYETLKTEEPDKPVIEHQAPRNGVEARLFNLWVQVLGHESFSITDSFFDLGTTSFQAIQLVSRIRQAFEHDLPVATLFTAPTIAEMAQLLSGDTQLPEWSSLIPIKPSGRKSPLFLVHHGGGGLFGYSDIARYLDPDRPLYGLQEPGIENGQALPTSVEEIASLYVQEIQSVQPHGPYNIGGFCFGGVVAFEMAQQLQNRSECVEALILLDAIPPGYAPQITLEQRLNKHQSRIAKSSVTGKLQYIAGRIIKRAKWEVQRFYLAGRRMTEHTAFDLLELAHRPVPSHLRQRRLLELNGHLNDDYVPRPYTGRTILIRATYPDLYYAEDFGWGTLIQPDVTVFQMATQDHLQMLAHPHVHTLIQHLQEALMQDTH